MVRKIIQLKSENVKRLKAVEITPDGNLVVIAGKNGAGKTSVLDSIEYALGGKGSLPDRPIRDGESKAKIEVRLDGQPPLIVTRTITAKGGGQLKITSGDGMQAQSPQTLLDSLCGAIAFDPLQFTRMEPKKQVETLRELLGLDFTALDAEAKEVFEQRTAMKREAATLKARLDGMISVPEAPEEEVSVSELLAQLERCREVNLDNQDLRRDLDKLDSDIAEAQRKIDETEARLAQYRQEMVGHKQERQKLAATCENLQDEDTAEVEQQIHDAEKTNAGVRANLQRAGVAEDLEHTKRQAAEATEKLEKIAANKKRQLAEAKWPIEGLGFTESAVTYNGLPVDQASSAEQLLMSMAIGAAMHPELGVLLFRDGSLLDGDSFALAAKFAAEKEMQLWLERVGTDDPCSVVIEDGQVREEAPADVPT